MNETASSPSSIWLESPDGTRHVVTGTCGLGRSRENLVFIDDHNVSRRHASIQVHQKGEVWLVDHNSKNGTILNGRRIVWPAILNDGDRIEIGDHRFIFHQTGERDTTFDSGVTVQKLEARRCWLLLADIVNSVELAQLKSAMEWSESLGQWRTACRRIIEKAGGNIDKFMGDAFLAYWAMPESGPGRPDETAECLGVESRVVTALNDLRTFHPAAKLPFRVVVHVADLSLGPTDTPGERIMQSNELNFIFRLEEAAGRTQAHFCLSSEAQSGLDPLLKTEEVPGEHVFQGYDGRQQIFRVL